MVHRFSSVLLAVVLSSVFSQVAWADERPMPKSLWQAVRTPPTTDQPPTPRRPWVLHDREIALDLPLLHVLKDAGASPILESPLISSIAPTMSWMSCRRSPAVTIPPSSAVHSSPLRGETLPLSPAAISLSGPYRWAIVSIRLSTSPTVGCVCSKSIPKNCHRIDLHSSQPVAIPRSLCHTVPCLACMIHEHFCCNRGFAAAHAFGGQARRSLPRRTIQVRLGSSRLCVPVSLRDCAISQRTVMKHAG